MPKEIEHKYLIDKEAWKGATPDRSHRIKQGYLSTDPDKTVRVRTRDDKGFITIKGKTHGATRLEYEYEIPVIDATELLASFCTNIIEKVRHVVTHDNKLWEVDEFEGLNAGLVVAEIVLSSEEEQYTIPPWIGKNVTDDMRYANSNLSVRPFRSW
jgi:adenylate cyclase